MTTAPAPNTNNLRRRTQWMVGLSLFFLALGLAWFLYWILVGRFFVTTDDAYVSGNQVILTSQVQGWVSKIYGDNTTFVNEGEVLVELDKTDFLLKVEEKKSELANTVRRVSQLFQTVKEKEAVVSLRRFALSLAEFGFTHRQGLVETGALSLEEYERNKIALDQARSNLQLAQEELKEAQIATQNTTVETHPLVREAITAFQKAVIDLLRCQIISPVKGYIARRAVQVGDYATPGKTFLMVVPLDYLWLDANYKETQLKNVRVGQCVTFTSDLYGNGVKFHGQVVGFTAGTGSAFALLPPQNASGNWIKIIQRLPVRITIDPEEIHKYPLFIGLSLYVSVDVHDTSGSMISPVPPSQPTYVTQIYAREKKALEEPDQEIEKIVQENKG